MKTGREKNHRNNELEDEGDDEDNKPGVVRNYCAQQGLEI